jgi:DNA end-binding protein Ku
VRVRRYLVKLLRDRIGTDLLEAALVEAMAGQWKPEQYHDDYHDAVMAYVKKKHKEGENFKPPEPEEEKPSKAADLMELLQKSLSGRKIAPKVSKPKAHR